MAPQPNVPGVTQQKLHDLSIHSAELELRYERSSHLVDIISKDEDLRRMRFDIHVLEDDNDELRDLLAQEEDRSDAFQNLVNENLQRAEYAEAQLQEIETALRTSEQQIGALQAEAKAFKTTAADSEAFLTEKLALTRELSILRPELEHLKTQAASNEALMADKLDLQRQLSEIQCELENAKRDTKRALAKRRNTGFEIAKEVEVEELRRELAKEKRARQRAEEAADVTQNDINIDDVRKELAREKRARQKAEEELEAAQDNTQLEEVRRELLKVKKAKQKADDKIVSLENNLEQANEAATQAVKPTEGNTTEIDEQMEDLRQELVKEKKDRSRLEKSMTKSTEEFEAQKAMLNEKLGQFRTKLRSTRDKLKEAEAELAAAKEAAKAVPAPNNTKKRNADRLDAEVALQDSPEGRPAVKRGRKGPAHAGEVSTFSITPFLNRTFNADIDNEAEEDDNMDSPVMTQQRKGLVAKTASQANVQKKAAPRQKKQKAPTLEIVTEEAEDIIHDEGQENSSSAKQQQAPKSQTTKIKTKLNDGPDDLPEGTDAPAKKKKKIRKSLADFEAFNKEPEPELQKKKQKPKSKPATAPKRKLGGLGKSLLFDDDDEALAAQSLKLLPPGKNFFGKKGLGLGLGLSGFGGVKKNVAAGGGGGGGGLLGGAAVPKLGSSSSSNNRGSLATMTTEVSGFQFSPLKRNRRNLDDTLRG